MTNSNPDSNPGDFEHIIPAEVDLSATDATAAYGPTPADQRPRRRWFAWIAVAALAAAVAAVVFVLPAHVGAPAPAPANATSWATPATQTSAAPAAPAGGHSPWSAAQQEQMRRESQDTLQKLLNAQQQLEQMNVKSWAGTGYAKALKLAGSGDAAYQAQHYDQAKSLYDQALDAMQSLLQQAVTEFQLSMQQGGQALEAGDSKSATAAFQRALLIRPEDPDAAHGLKRAGNLDQVLSLIAAGDTQRDGGLLDGARDSYQQALNLDPETTEARQRLKGIKARIEQRDFSSAMSQGFDALKADRPDDAKTQFEEALRLKPGAQAARDGLRQAEDRITSKQIDTLLAQAARQAKSEDWNGAIRTYDAALKIDPTLEDAHRGRAEARKRADLNLRLIRAIARPDRLADKDVRDDEAALLLKALAVKHPGRRLKKQIAMLGTQLKQSVEPVEITFRSDNATQVTLYHVGVLGSFDQRQMTLRPGHYVAVGSRAGYRDVRVEFDVAADGPPSPVVVQCGDKISVDN